MRFWCVLLTPDGELQKLFEMVVVLTVARQICDINTIIRKERESKRRAREASVRDSPATRASWWLTNGKHCLSKGYHIRTVQPPTVHLFPERSKSIGLQT